MQTLVVGVDKGGLTRVQVEVKGRQSLLRLPCLAAVSEPFVSNALVKSVLGDENQLVLCLNENLGICELSERFHVRQFVELAGQGFLVARTTRVTRTSGAMKGAFSGGKGRCHRFFWKIGQNSLAQR